MDWKKTYLIIILLRYNWPAISFFEAVLTLINTYFKDIEYVTLFPLRNFIEILVVVKNVYKGATKFNLNHNLV